jgi:hypothetical protein
MVKNTEEKALGICLGASTISAVRLIKDEKGIRIDKVIRRHHEGNPKDEFRTVLYEMDPGEKTKSKLVLNLVN